jgi:S-adenosylmethionine-dependent methyltransferase
MNEIDDIEQYYNAGVEVEWTRMDRRPVEFEMTKRHIRLFLKPQSRIADVGGGPGRYSLYLAQLGHKVTLVDLAQRNLDRAADEAAAIGLSLERYLHSSAVSMRDLADDSYDVVLCLGPMYHLTEAVTRESALRECVRILKPEGHIIISFLSPFSHAISLIVKHHLEQLPAVYEEFRHILHHHRNINPQLVEFTHAWYPDPSGIAAIVEPLGVTTERIAAAESLGWALEDKLYSLSPSARDCWMDYLFEISCHPSVVGACQHILYCGRKSK